jgi:biofilm PGA synthesis protein PgaA
MIFPCSGCMLRLRFYVSFFTLLLVGAIYAGGSEAPRARREAAVVQARNGDAKNGLAALQELLLQYPDDPRLLADTTIVANWAGNDQLVLDLFARPLTPKDDSGVVEAAARSARNLDRFEQSVELFRRAEKLDPSRWQPQLGEAMALTELGEFVSAQKLMQPLLLDHKSEKDVILGEAYLASRQTDFIGSIAMDQYYLEQSPSNTQVRSDLTLALSRAGSQTYAADIYSKDVTPLVPQTEQVLSGAAGGEQVGWGEVYAPTRALERADSELALEKLNRVVTASVPGDGTWKLAQYDRILAFYDLRQMRDVIQLYEQLRRAGLDVRTYALSSVAGAYLALHQPKRAEELYRELLKQEPEDGTAWSGLAYAQMESGHPYKALATIDYAYNAAAPWLKAPGLSAPKANHMRVSLESQAADMRGEANLLADEMNRFNRLVTEAPGNENLRWGLASSYLARGWVQRALDETRIADSFGDPDELPSLTTAEIREAAGLRDQVDVMIPALRIHLFDSSVFQQFLRDESIERGWQAVADTTLGWGNGLEVGSSDQHSEAHLYTPLLDNRWRIYSHELSDSGDFGTASAERTRAAVGVHYDYDRREAWAEFGHDSGTNLVAGNIGAKVSLGDFWTLQAVVDSDSFDVPVRALTGNVHGRSIDGSVEWRRSELQSANAGLQRVLFSDGNQRAAISAAWDQRVWTTPRWEASISADESSSSNSLDENRPYFNPKNDFSLGPGGKIDWITWQRYDRRFDQELEVHAAPYWQANYGTGSAVSVRYGQRWKLRSGLEWRCGVAWNSQPYDGSNESRTALNGGITWGSQ